MSPRHPASSTSACRIAKPPVGELRWHEPEPAAGWEGTLDASKAGPDCPQPVNGDSDGSLSENCLYLNVYAPAASTKQKDKLPVVVFLHGGGYTGGTPNIYDGRDFTATGEAIAVIPAFRVGLFGFFPTSTEESEFGAQGNWGLLDQQEALRWVQENIDAFGGDPENVTIVGESAGARIGLLPARVPDGRRPLRQGRDPVHRRVQRERHPGQHGVVQRRLGLR